MNLLIGRFIGRTLGTAMGKRLIRRAIKYGFQSYIDFEGRQIASPSIGEKPEEQRAKAMLKLAPMLMSEIFPTLENVRLSEPDAIFLENFRRAYIHALQLAEAKHSKLLKEATGKIWDARDDIEAADKFIKLLTVAVQADNYPRDMFHNARMLFWVAYESCKKDWETKEDGRAKFINEHPSEEPTFLNALTIERRLEHEARLSGIIAEQLGREVTVTREGTRYTIKEVDHGKHSNTAPG